MKKWIELLLVTILFTQCGDQKIDQQAEAEKLMDLSREWAQAARDRDVEKIVDFWAEDAVIMAPDEPPVRGKKKIQMMLKIGMRKEGFEIYWEPQEAYVAQSGDLGYVLVKTYMTFPDTSGAMQKVYHTGVEIWKKQEDQSWKNVVDIYNRDPSIKSLK